MPVTGVAFRVRGARSAFRNDRRRAIVSMIVGGPMPVAACRHDQRVTVSSRSPSGVSPCHPGAFVTEVCRRPVACCEFVTVRVGRMRGLASGLDGRPTGRYWQRPDRTGSTKNRAGLMMCAATGVRPAAALSERTGAAEGVRAVSPGTGVPGLSADS